MFFLNIAVYKSDKVIEITGAAKFYSFTLCSIIINIATTS